MKYLTRVAALVLVACNSLIAQRLEKFTFSGCMWECRNDSSKIEGIQSVKSLTLINVKTYAPCNGNFVGGVEAYDDLVNLTFRTKPTIIKDSKGNVHEVIEVADCNCVFLFLYEVYGLAKVTEQSIRINGLSLKEINARNIYTELLIELDTIK
jgi:hypothetical protein